LVEETVEVTAAAESPPAETWSEEALRRAVGELQARYAEQGDFARRIERLNAMLRAYEEAKERERIEEEEAWILMA
jgi:hypothetical protein